MLNFSFKRKYLIQTGPFTLAVSTSIKDVQTYIESHYGDQLRDETPNTFIDFNLELNHGKGLRRWFKQQATFHFNHHEPFKPLPLEQANAMLEWGMNWVIASYAHQYLIIHAATLEKDGQGIIISAPSGSGKSTLCAYLAANGWRLLSDELALVDPNTLELHGLGRPINLKNQSVDIMRGYYPTDSFSRIIKDTHKGQISLVKPLNQGQYKNDKSSPLTAIPQLLIFVNYQADEVCYAEPVSKSVALTEVIQNSFNFGLLNQDGFSTASQLVNQADAVFIEYGQFEACESVIEEYLNAKSANINTKGNQPQINQDSGTSDTNRKKRTAVDVSGCTDFS
ncbi:hypothetical protein A3K86_15035 [Photobacterium jeanii]|uniref:Serine kinase n=1 Tax=Photobacterium jeanii TaxID=858640 RepID=A0A178K8J6_9GAMM|nr:HprK-related kinase A [Photobacterium jeanii]OAN12983.1 hypothetical protein A3K86_15035 [Photobacterium jeanii]PST89130.1 HprK-related kinase A [Photobacterium jeanii]